MKTINTMLFTLFLSLNFLNAQETKEMTNEEFMKKMMELEQRQKDAKDKTEAVEKVRKDSDKLVKMLQKEK